MPYSTAPSQEWADAVSTWEWEQNENGDWMVSNVCPHCKHRFTYVRERVMLMEKDDAGEFFIMCTCDHEHPGRPAHIHAGCGKAAKVPRPKV